MPPKFRDAEISVSPMAEATWLASKETSLSLGFRQGFRAGGVAVRRIDSQYTDAIPPGFYLFPYRPDRIRVASLELIHRSHGARPLDLDAAVSVARWSRIQGTLIDEFGFLYSASTGWSTSINLDLSASWRIKPDLSLSAGTSITKGRYTGLTDVIHETSSVPTAAAYASLDWQRPLSAEWKLGVGGRVAYRGKSRLGLGFLHNIDQGDVLFTTVGARLTHDAYNVSFSVENLTDDRSSLFGYGNPFTVRTESQSTPQRPRTLSVSFHADF